MVSGVKREQVEAVLEAITSLPLGGYFEVSIKNGPHPSTSRTTFPCTSVSRKSRPWKRKVSFSWSKPS